MHDAKRGSRAEPGEGAAHKRSRRRKEGGFFLFFFFFLSVAQPDQNTHTCQSERWRSTAAPLSGIEMQSNKWRSSDARTHEATSRVLLGTALRLRHQQDDWIWQIFRPVAITLKLVGFCNGVDFLFSFSFVFSSSSYLKRGSHVSYQTSPEGGSVFQGNSAGNFLPLRVTGRGPPSLVSSVVSGT